MTIDWNSFTPFSSLAGGALIGTAAAVLMWWQGRIAGISGIVGGLLQAPRGESAWRLAFVAGLVAAPALGGVVAQLPAVHIEAGMGTLIVSGLLVGLGTRYASGCTSGHGVCGLSLRSARSMVATLAFMGAGFATVFVVRHAWATGFGA
ncbi:YeeE/YedE family protein [Ideonella sp. DXS29W]|uniref:YeeE/YedE family protein n=1 Tax=Ideonella lacteola TaxID=2984193 RepID=A0ABU9BYB3_9BURK